MSQDAATNEALGSGQQHVCCYCTKQPVPLPCCNPGHYKTATECPAAKRHTKCPEGYLAWHEWAEKKSRAHEQTRCPTCGFYAIWKRKSVPAPIPLVESSSVTPNP